MKKMHSNLALYCSGVSKTFNIGGKLNLWSILSGQEQKSSQLFQALHDISLEVPRGKIIGILGRNGAGKSTLLRLLGKIYTPTRGNIEAFGIIAGLFELGGTSNPNLTGREYAIRYLRYMGVLTKNLASVLDEIKDFSELAEAFDQRIRTYSSGMAARLYFAVATSYQHDIYLIDEILSVGDEHFQAKCWRRMRTRLLNGASGVLVTHDWVAILNLCETACVIEDGTFSYVGPSDKAVVSYLQLPKPIATAARFTTELQDEYKARSGETMHIKVPVEIVEPGSVFCALSIEVLNIGIGWEIIILSDQKLVHDLPGHYEVTFEIANLPLIPGTYSLNLFLNHSTSDKGDIRSWTYGNGLRLIVDGEMNNSAVRIPFIARTVSREVK
jgi:lipopolysaccharide transport system ATP-binding protein